MLRELQETVIRTVRIGDSEYFTLDDYSNETAVDAMELDGESGSFVVGFSYRCCSRTARSMG